MCTISLLWVFTDLRCDPDPALYLPAGRFGRALAASGVVGVTADNYVALPLAQVRAAGHRVAVARRRALRDAGASSGRVVAIEAVWHPAALPQDACDVVTEPRGKRAPEPGEVEALGLCAGNVLLWNLWSGGVTAVWVARASCEGRPAAFLISSREPSDDAVVFAVIGGPADDLLSRVGHRE